MDWGGSWTTPPCGCCKCCRHCRYNKIKKDPQDPLGWADYIFTGAAAADDNDLNATSSLFEAMAIASAKSDSSENWFDSFDTTVPYDYGRDYSDPWADKDRIFIQNRKGNIQSEENEFDHFDFGQELDRRFVSDYPPAYKPNYGHTWDGTNSIEDTFFSGGNNNVDVTSSFIEAVCNSYDDGDADRVRSCNNGPKWPSYEYEEENSFGSSSVLGLIDALLAPIDALVNFISETFGGSKPPVDDFGGRRPSYPWGSTDISSIPITIPSIPDKIKDDEVYEFRNDNEVYKYFRKEAIEAEELEKEYSAKERAARARGDLTFAEQNKQLAEVQNRLAKDLHKEAAKKILAHKNRNNDQWKLDLHCLKVDEAVDAFLARLRTIESDLTNKEGKKRLQVITGRGLHSPGGDARIRAAVEDILDDEGYDFEEINKGGSFLIRPKFHKQ